MTDTTLHLGLPLIAAAQAQKHVTHNEALALLDAIVQLTVSERRAAPPADPDDRARYLVTDGASGAFAGQPGAIVWRDLGTWRFLAPEVGWRALVAGESRIVVFDGALWRDLGAFVGSLDSVERLGIGTVPDAANPLAAKLNAALWTARGTGEGGTGDLRMVVNKEAAARTASQLFQSGYSGRAEFGLVGDDDFRIKVSADGAAWTDGLRIARATGIVDESAGLTVAGQPVWHQVTAASALAASGHQRLPSGLILQWGSGQATGSDPAVAFPIAFPNACLALVATCRLSASETGLVACATDLVTAAGFRARPRVIQSGGAISAAGQRFDWFALGH